MKKIVTGSAGGLRGEIEAPADKSVSHRAIILSSIAEGSSKITNFLRAADCMSTLNALKSAGARIEDRTECIVVEGVGIRGLREPDDVIDAGNSGTTARLLAGLLAGQDFFSVITGDGSLRKRPMRRVVDPLNLMGAEIRGRENAGKLPLAINGKRLLGIEYKSPVASAQIKSAILLAGLTAEGKTAVYEPSPSRDHTERMLLAMGAKGGRDSSNGFFIEGGGKLKAGEIEVPGDISSAAFFIVAATLVEGSEILIRNTGINPTRTGIVDVIRAMGGDIRYENERTAAGEPVADIMVRSRSLKGVEIKGDIIPRLIDEIPVIAVAASLAEGKTVIRGAHELRLKESDRINTITQELSKFGVVVEELEDGLVVEGREFLEGAEIRSHDDHRIAMSMAVAGLRARGETVIHNAGCVNISFPGFFDLLNCLQY